MGVKFTNNAEGVLAAGITDVATTLTVGSGQGDLFPVVLAASGDYFWATLIDTSGNREIIKVTERQNGSNVFATIIRAQDDTSAQAFLTADKVQLRFPKVVLEDFRDDIATNIVDIAALDGRVTAIEADDNLMAPTGTKMFFYQDTAPSGWTLDAGPADSLLAIKGGAQVYDDTGGQVLGSWTPTTHTHTGPSHSHTGPSHTHTGPSHTHTMGTHTHTMGTHNHKWYNYRSSNSSQSYDSGGNALTWSYNHKNSWSQLVMHIVSADGWSDSDDYWTANVDPGDTNATDPGDTNAGGTGATGSSGTDATGVSGTGLSGTGSAPSTDRPQAAVGIIATKD